jgi:hypothetical protein
MNGKLDVAEQALNAFIIAGIAFFAALGASIFMGQPLSYPPDPAMVYTGAIAGGLTFFVQFAYERGVNIAPRIKEKLP